eukprot:c16378_g1_i1.p1 GENE.c16378_g1_i1~~c16378_g1_i1.p1  ORF type:complete len:255 (+),score=113.40 c16378_g1_i1:136-900(+)
MEEELEKFQIFSLVSRVCVELDNHLHINDKTLAEFVIELALQHPNAEALVNVLEKQGIKFPVDLAANLIRLVMNEHPSAESATQRAITQGITPQSATDSKNNHIAKFPGLALHNTSPLRLDERITTNESSRPSASDFFEDGNQKKKEKHNRRSHSRSRSRSRDRDNKKTSEKGETIIRKRSRSKSPSQERENKRQKDFKENNEIKNPEKDLPNEKNSIQINIINPVIQKKKQMLLDLYGDASAGAPPSFPTTDE